MSDETGSWWGVRRGALNCLIRVEREPTAVSGAEVRWTRNDPEYCGIVNANPKPIGVFDVAEVLRLPAEPLTNDHWVLLGNHEETPWAVASDTKPAPVNGTEETVCPTLPSAAARKLVVGCRTARNVDFHVIEPQNWTPVHISPAGPAITDERIISRLARAEAEYAATDTRPGLLICRVGHAWWGLAADAVLRVTRVGRIAPLPGAPGSVWGLTTIGGRINIVVDPAHLFGLSRPALPCHVAIIMDKGRKWAIAAPGEWRAITASELESVEDRTPVAGPPGVVAYRTRYEGDSVLVLSVEILREMARGEQGEASRAL